MTMRRDTQNVPPPGNPLHYTASTRAPLMPSSVTPRTGDSRLQNLLSQDDLFPSWDQPTHSGILGAPPQGPWWPGSACGPSQMPIPSRFTEAGTQMTSAPHSRSDRYWKPRFRASAEDRVHAYCARPDWHTVNRGPSLRLSADGFFGQNTNLPFADVKSHGPDLLTHPSHYQPPCVSHEQSKYATTAHPTLSFQRHPGHTGIIEALGPTGAQLVPEIESMQGSEHASEVWLCGLDGCEKTYGRKQELRRHVRARHGIPRTCPFCPAEWNRADLIRKHLATRHRDRFTEEGLHEIGRLWGRKSTISFLRRCGMTTYPSPDFSDSGS